MKNETTGFPILALNEQWEMPYELGEEFTEFLQRNIHETSNGEIYTAWFNRRTPEEQSQIKKSPL